MDEEDRFSASSGESERDNERDNERDEACEDGEDGNNDNEAEEENNDDDDDDDEGDNEAEGEAAADGRQQTHSDEPVRIKTSKPATPAASTIPWRPTVRPEALTAKLYDIVPTMAAPQSTSINAMAITPDLRYWITGGTDGYIRKYDGLGTINGKLALTVAQKHPFVDSVHKAGILMSYWENEEPLPPGRGDQDHVLSPVYSLAVHSDALWLLSGLESGGINLQSVRHDEGKKMCCLQLHTSAVSVLTLAPDEKSVLSGGWDKKIFDWDLNTGQTKRSFDGSGGQISSIELRPANGDAVPAEADEPLPSTTMATNNGAPLSAGAINGLVDGAHSAALGEGEAPAGAADGQASPAHESLFGGSDAGSLFGETAGEQPFGHDDDGFGTGMEMMGGHEGGMDHSADMAMADMEMGRAPECEVAAQTQDSMDIDATSQAQAEDSAAAVAFQKAEEGSKEPAHPQPTEDKELPKRWQSPTVMSWQAPPPHFDPWQTSATTFLSSAIDGTIRIWDRRAANPVARIGTRAGVPPWCMSACWSPNGNMIYAGRRNGTVEEYDVRRARRVWEPERTLRFPAGSGAVSAIKPMVNGRHLVWYVFPRQGRLSSSRVRPLVESVLLLTF